MVNQNPELSQVIAHRGASAYAPENTLVAFHLAHEMGAKWVECDVRRTKTNDLVTIHDSTLKTTTNGFGQISNANINQVRKLDAGSWFSSQFKQQRVPSLDQVMLVCSRGGMSLNIEIKGPLFDRQTVPLLVQYLARYWPIDGPNLLISSRSKRMLRDLRLLAPQLPLSFITNRLNQRHLEFMRSINAFSCHIRTDGLSQQVIDSVKALNMRIGVFTINDAYHASELFSMGVDAVFSNHPNLLDD